MIKRHLLFSSLIAAAMLTCCTTKEETADYRIIPAPYDVSVNEAEKPFKLSGSTVISYPDDNDSLKNEAEFLSEYIANLTGHNLKIVTSTPSSDAIILRSDIITDNPEAYEITINPSTITINGSTDAGVFYGIQTLRKSIPAINEKQNVLFPSAKITDRPRFAYRGAHLDVARHFFPVDSIKTFIDMLALHNINTFHWHLTDDQGWRIEIKRRPELTELGSVRNGTVIGHNSGQYDSIPYGGFYTREEAREIIEYAADRHINVIPEIDMPGHMLGALKAYPNLGCQGGPYEVWQQWGVSPDVLCAGNDSTYQFINEVLTEITEIFPSEYIHIGGDECPKVRWEECEKCQAKIKELGLTSDKHSTKEEKLQSHIIKYAGEVLAAHGRKLIGWDEILEGGLNPGAIVMSWRGESGGIEAARQGHEVIMTPNTYMYFDYYQSLDRDKEPEAIGGYLPLEKVYSYEPYSKSLTPEQASLIKGVQANLWTEYIPTFSQAQYMELPRMAALSETQWSDPGKKDFKDFASRLPNLTAHYDANGYNYAKHIFNIKGELETDTIENAIKVTLTTVDDAPIFVTFDGSTPNENSNPYEGPFMVDSTTVIKAIAIRPNGTSEIFADSVSFSKSTAHPIAITYKPHPNYKAKGAATLVDGKLGPDNYGSGFWVGFYNNDLEAVIDLQKTQKISEVTLRCCVVTGDWIFDAKGIKVEVSTDGEKYTTVKEEHYPTMTGHFEGIVPHRLSFEPQDARYVIVTAQTENVIPEWHNGAGNKGFLFVDEIMVN